MRPIRTTLYVLALVASTSLFVSCQGPQAVAGQDLLDTMNAATADGVVTPEEIALIKEKLSVLVSAGFDWQSAIGIGISTLLAAFGLQRYVIPNRMILGPNADADVRRAAGLKEAGDPR